MVSKWRYVLLGKAATPFWCKLIFTFLLKLFDANNSPVINVKTFLPAIDGVILRITTIEQKVFMHHILYSV